jgi:osmotically-inducible protein OsmY
MMRRCLIAAALVLRFACTLGGCALNAKCTVPACSADAEITAQVRALIDRHPALQAPNSISVQTVDRIVYLRGLVDTPFMSELAQSVALQAKGAARVVNLIGIENER